MPILEIVTIAGSPSRSSKSSLLLDFARDFLQKEGASVHSIVVRDLPAEDLLHANFSSPVIQANLKLIADCKALIITTPVYKAAYVGILKAFLDLFPPDVLAGKTVLPIVTGASPQHSLVLDYAFKPVLAALGASSILSGLYIMDSQLQVVEQNQLQLDPKIQTKIQDLLRQIIKGV